MKTQLILLLTAFAAVLTTTSQAAHADEAVTIPETFKQRLEVEGWSQEWHDSLYGHDHNQAIAAAVRKMLRAKRDAAALESGLVAHEWGSMQHHLGTSTSEFDVMGENQADLPPFVKVWSQQPRSGPQLIRKPILYFYTREPKKVSVTARFPEGLLTQWHPDVTTFAPQPTGRQLPGSDLPSNGTLSWQDVELNPDFAPSLFANVNQNHPWWHIARDTDATPLRVTKTRTGQAYERFLFYRGAGTYKPMVVPKRDQEDDGFQ